MKLTAGLMTVFLLAGMASAQAESLLGVAPLRVILSDAKTSEVLTLSNRSDRTRTYKVTLQDQVMNGEGNIIQQDDFPYSAKRMLRFMPRQVTLAAGERQSIRVMVTPPADLAEGEYHTHLLFDEVMPVVKDVTDTKALKLNMENAYSVGLPMIYQRGKVEGKLGLAGARLVVQKNGKPAFDVMLTRSGNGEGNGLIKVIEEGGAESLVAPRNMHMYREVDKVTLRMPLRDGADTNLQALQAKKLRVELVNDGALLGTVPVGE